jgi:hypothetical protein
LLCFGEIDCRAHIFKQAQIQKKSIEEIVEICINRYFTVIKILKNRGYEVFIWNVIPSALGEGYCSDEYPYYGTSEERNYIAKCFNNALEEKLRKENIFFLNIFDKLLIKEGIIQKKYLFDDIHLSQKAMPLVLKELRSYEFIKKISHKGFFL